jgi:regulator of replication initiation timing
MPQTGDPQNNYARRLLVDENATLRAEVARLRKALSQLLRVIEHDELIPESMSYMQQARKALTLPKTQETP